MNVDRLGAGALLAVPGALVVYFGFNAGGFFPAQPAVGAVFLALVLTVRVACARAPFAGLSRYGAVAAGALSLYAVWTLVSAAWSHAPARALVEFDRALMYALAVLLFASLPRSRQRLQWMLGGVLAGILVVCAAALTSRLLPQVLLKTTFANARLSYPVSYWNTLGLLAALGVVLCLHFASSRRERVALRALAAAPIPALTATMYFTLSRGAIVGFAVGVIAYLALTRSWASLRAVVAIAPATAVAALVAYRADALTTPTPTGPLAVQQGHRVALAVVVCGLVAALALLALSLAARRWGPRMPAPGRRVRGAVAAVVGICLVGLAIAVHVPSRLSDGYERLVGDPPAAQNDIRQRLLSVGTTGRTTQWKSAFTAFDASPLHGEGAGTYQLAWERTRPYVGYIKDAHALYFEVLGELGIVGIVLLAAALIAMLAGAFSLRRHTRSISAVLLALLLSWGIRAGIDWDWEMPVLTLPVLALAAAGLARRQRTLDAPDAMATPARLVIGLCLLAATALPALVAVAEGQLTRATLALRRDDCATARRAALSSLSAIGSQARAYEVIGYCDLVQGSPRAARVAIERAIDHDPGNWQYRYGLAAMQAVDGLDPRSAAAATRVRNPLGPLSRDTRAFYRGSDPRRWRRQGRRAVSLILSDDLVGKY